MKLLSLVQQCSAYAGTKHLESQSDCYKTQSPHQSAFFHYSYCGRRELQTTHTIKPRVQASAFHLQVSGILSFPAILASLECMYCMCLVFMVKPSVQSTNLGARQALQINTSPYKPRGLQAGLFCNSVMWWPLSRSLNMTQQIFGRFIYIVAGKVIVIVTDSYKQVRKLTPWARCTEYNDLERICQIELHSLDI